MNFLVMIFAIWSKIEKKYTIHDQFSVTSFTVSVKLWHKKSDFSTVFKITIDEMFFMKNHASFWNHHMWEHFHFLFLKLSFWFDETLYIFTFLSETVKKKTTFFVKLTKLCRVKFKPNNSKILVFQFGHEILWPVLCKKWGFSCKPHLFLFFIVAQFHVKTGWNWWFFFCFIWLKKWNWLMVSWVKLA